MKDNVKFIRTVMEKVTLHVNLSLWTLKEEREIYVSQQYKKRNIQKNSKLLYIFMPF